MKYNIHFSVKASVFAFMFMYLTTFGVLCSHASEQHQHEAHVHGIAQLNLAMEGGQLYIEFTSPAANIVGFEHYPRTEAQKSAVHAAVATLKSAETLFTIPASAGAKLVNAFIESEMLHDHDHDADEHEHGEKHEKHDADEHEHGEEHAHQEADEHEQHSDFKVVYLFSVQNPDKLKYMDVNLFEAFKGIEHIKVQLLTPKMQTAYELSAKKTRISF